ncbi:uncharacterized protein LOC143899700 [Temnothorax americanus]|uniref:uncharacterized protein LOC143899700 n=1 Tax=Temnothorax americanus TaxID=1964332 RepID=UPI004067D177
MCDLIDLSSPDVRGALEPAKLASPLIPPPEGVECDDGTGTESATGGKREGDGNNNPFDRALRETVEYVSKKNDPFEVMLQRALRSKEWKSSQSVDFTDDFTPRRKKRYLKTMNKTLDALDESLLESRFGLFGGDKREAKIRTGSVDIDARNTYVRDGKAADDASVVEQEHKVSVDGPDSLELSILSRSAMNDTLFLSSAKPEENGEASPSLEKDTWFGGFAFSSNAKRLKPQNVQRSLSQGAGKSPKGLLGLNRRSQSVTDGRRRASQSTNSTVSSVLDRAFLESKLSERSVFSNLSNASSITKLTSASLSSSALSNDAMNNAFLDDGSLKSSQEKVNATESFVDIEPRKYDFSDLAERLNKLRYTMNDTTSTSSVTKNDSYSTKEENNKRTPNNKLIDVDVFVPEQNKEFNKSSSSTCSSDSVFANTSKVDRSILNEAKVLARTFEELALKTDSGSGTDDDLISNNTLWMSALLPAFDDEPVVDDLIDLPVSPEGYSRDIRNDDKRQSSTSSDSAEENLLKKLESPFTGVSVAKRDVSSLLSDLRKLIKAESNTEAKKLLDNLENILNVNYKNNTELLVTCLNISNKSQSSQKMSSDRIERSDKLSTDKSEEGSDKASFSEKLRNNEKSPDINCTPENTSQDIVSGSQKSSVTSSSCKDSNEDRTSSANSSDLTERSKLDKEKDDQVDKKIAVELLINLQKLLSGQAEDDATIQLLKNIGKVLNTALNNNIGNEMQATCPRKQNVRQTTPVRASQSGRNAYSSALSTRVAQRRSLEPKSKTVRRSVSAVESSPKSTSNTQIRGRRDTSELENRQKRFSSDPGFVNNLSSKKLAIPERNNTRKAEAAEPGNKEEKSIGISDVKNKLKKRSDVVSKRGPMKAVHPVDNMQNKRASVARQRTSFQVTTPPNSDKTTPLGNKMISSTPNSDNNRVPKKSAKSKPIASSTPDGQKSENAPLTSVNKKRNLSCDISPVTTYVNVSGSDERKGSPKRTSKLPTPKKLTTPTRQRTDAHGIPRFLTPPRNRSSLNTNNPRSPERLNRSLINFHRYSPVSEKKNAGKIRQSPLKESNRVSARVKPLNLISKIKRHSTGDFAEKENNCA